MRSVDGVGMKLFLLKQRVLQNDLRVLESNERGSNDDNVDFKTLRNFTIFRVRKVNRYTTTRTSTCMT